MERNIFLFVGGFGLLVGGAEMLVRGASRLAAAMGVAPVVIGLTVVAFGTSAPEVAITVQSVFAGQADLALGNVVGSNIANVLLILGLAAVAAPLVVSQRLIRWDVPIMIGTSLGVGLLAWDGTVVRWEGLLLLAGGIGYTVWALRQSRAELPLIQDEYAQEFTVPPHPSLRYKAIQVGLVLAGLVVLTWGARWLVEGAVAVARALGVSELIVGLTLVAVGTSLPEAATSVVASLRGERDIAVGNAVGSNLLNLLWVLGLASSLAPAGLSVSSAARHFDIPVMIAVAVACLPIFLHGHRISRWEGGLFLGYYLAYTLYLILAATHHQALPVFSTVMLVFALPLTTITLGILLIRALREQPVPR
jgi:cation:H+ antiporter